MERINAEVAHAWRAFRHFTTIARLVVRGVPAGASVELRCIEPKPRAGRRRRCAFKRKGVPVRGSQANARAALKRKSLKVGVTLEVRIVKPAAVGKVVRFKIRARKLPEVSRLCLPPGATQPGSC